MTTMNTATLGGTGMLMLFRLHGVGPNLTFYNIQSMWKLVSKDL